MDYKELLATWPQDASGQPEKARLTENRGRFPGFWRVMPIHAG